MTIFGFIDMLRLLGVVIFMPLAGLAFAGVHIYEELSLRAHFRAKCGAQWQAEYERYHGSLATANIKLLACVLAMIAICVLSWILYRQFVPKHRGLLRRRRHSS